MTTRRTFLATAAAAAVCPLPAQTKMLTVPVDVPAGDLVVVLSQADVDDMLDAMRYAMQMQPLTELWEPHPWDGVTATFPKAM